MGKRRKAKYGHEDVRVFEGIVAGYLETVQKPGPCDIGYVEATGQSLVTQRALKAYFKSNGHKWSPTVWHAFQKIHAKKTKTIQSGRYFRLGRKFAVSFERNVRDVIVNSHEGSVVDVFDMSSLVLKDRTRQCLALMVAGVPTIKEISEALGVCTATVERNIQRLNKQAIDAGCSDKVVLLRKGSYLLNESLLDQIRALVQPTQAEKEVEVMNEEEQVTTGVKADEDEMSIFMELLRAEVGAKPDDSLMRILLLVRRVCRGPA